mmetsp:Transcript_22985/g.58083  ORF Transcript_22985/g.58083 Transcript_22985/m.58083 type:complete len:236 (+) Transcript_22985:859-1566(+)
MEAGGAVLLQFHVLHRARLHVEQIHVVDDRGPLLVGQLHRPRVRHPAVDTAPPRIHEHEVLETKVVNQNLPEEEHGGFEKRPALGTNLRAGATGADLVVVVHVDIENEFSFDWKEQVLVQAVFCPWLHAVDRANLHAVWFVFQNRLLPVLITVIRIEPYVDFWWQLESDFPLLVFLVTTHPLHEVLEGKVLLVVRRQKLVNVRVRHLVREWCWKGTLSGGGRSSLTYYSLQGPPA